MVSSVQKTGDWCILPSRFGNGIPGHTTRAPPFARGGRVRTGDLTTASPPPWPQGHDDTSSVQIEWIWFRLCEYCIEMCPYWSPNSGIELYGFYRKRFIAIHKNRKDIEYFARDAQIQGNCLRCDHLCQNRALKIRAELHLISWKA